MWLCFGVIQFFLFVCFNGARLSTRRPFAVGCGSCRNSARTELIDKAAIRAILRYFSSGCTVASCASCRRQRGLAEYFQPCLEPLVGKKKRLPTCESIAWSVGRKVQKGRAQLAPKTRVLRGAAKLANCFPVVSSRQTCRESR